MNVNKRKYLKVRKLQKNKNPYRKRKNEATLSTVDSQSSFSSSISSSLCDTSLSNDNDSSSPILNDGNNQCTSMDIESFNQQNFVQELRQHNLCSLRPLTSSPINFDHFPSNDADITYDFSNDCDEDLLHHNTDVTVSAFSSSFVKIISEHHISDAAATALLNLITNILPCPNNCPSLYELHKNTKKDLENVQIVSKPEGTYYLLDIEKQVNLIIQRQPNIFNYISNVIHESPAVLSDIHNGSKFVFSDSQL